MSNIKDKLIEDIDRAIILLRSDFRNMGKIANLLADTLLNKYDIKDKESH